MGLLPDAPGVCCVNCETNDGGDGHPDEHACEGGGGDGPKYLRDRIIKVMNVIAVACYNEKSGGVDDAERDSDKHAFEPVRGDFG